LWCWTTSAQKRRGQVVATAILEVLAPTTRQRIDVAEHRLDGLIERCRNLKPMLTGVVHPCSADALAGVVEAGEAGLILPVLYGPESEIRQIADRAHLEIAKCRLVATDGPEDSAQKAAMAAGAGEVAALMKGSLHTDVLLHAIMQKDAKLRTGRLISHCVMVSAPTYARRFVLSDVALNIAPDTDQKRDICQNAIGFARARGIDLPKVAVLAAVEMVQTKMPATLDGAILAKMADRASTVGLKIEPHGGCGDDLDVEIGEDEAGGGADAVEPPAHDVERVLGGVKQNAPGAWHSEATQARNAGRDRDGEVQGEEGFAALGLAADDPDRLLGPQPSDEPALFLGAIGEAPGGFDGQQAHRRRPAAALASAAGGAAHVSRNSFSSICRASRSAAYTSSSPAMFMRARRLPWA
jgi:hypothetical protein